jgi:hypothetical protein
MRGNSVQRQRFCRKNRMGFCAFSAYGRMKTHVMDDMEANTATIA